MFYNNYTREQEIEMTKKFYEGEKYDYHIKRFVSEEKIKADKYLKEQDYFPLQTYKEIINERVEMTPTDFSVTGKEKDFLKKHFIEEGLIFSKLPQLYLEQELSGDAFWKVRVKESIEPNLLYDFDFELLRSEEMIVILDTYTLNPIKFINEYEILVQNEDRSYQTEKIKETYTLESIKIETIVPSNKMIFKNEKYEKIIDNPFKEYGVMPILWFRGYRKNNDRYSKIPSFSLVEPTLQLDYDNTDKEMIIHRNAMPIVEVKKAMRKYGNIELGAGAVWYSRGDEELKIHTSELYLTELNENLRMKIDAMYKLASLVPIGTRSQMYSSSSSKIAKYASKEFIELTKTRLENIKIELKKVIKLFLEINGKTYTNEEIAVPSDILSIDKEELIKNIAMELSLGLIDDVYVWNKYYPELTEGDRARIIKFRKENEMDSNDENLNIDNNVKAGEITGNKKTNSLDNEDKEGVTSKN